MISLLRTLLVATEAPIRELRVVGVRSQSEQASFSCRCSVCFLPLFNLPVDSITGTWRRGAARIPATLSSQFSTSAVERSLWRSHGAVLKPCTKILRQVFLWHRFRQEPDGLTFHPTLCSASVRQCRAVLIVCTTELRWVTRF